MEESSLTDQSSIDIIESRLAKLESSMSAREERLHDIEVKLGELECSGNLIKIKIILSFMKNSINLYY